MARWMLCQVPDLHAALPMTTGPRDVAGRFDPDALAGLFHRCHAISRIDVTNQLLAEVCPNPVK